MVLKEFVNQFTMHGINNVKVKNYLSSKKRELYTVIIKEK